MVPAAKRLRSRARHLGLIALSIESIGWVCIAHHLTYNVLSLAEVSMCLALWGFLQENKGISFLPAGSRECEKRILQLRKITEGG